MATEKQEHYATIKIPFVKLENSSPLKKGSVYFVVFFGDEKIFQSGSILKAWDPHPRWPTPIEVEIRNEDQSSVEFKVVLHSEHNWKKNKYLGECSIKVADVLRSAPHSEIDEPIQFRLINKKKHNREVNLPEDAPAGTQTQYCVFVSFEVTGAQILIKMIQDPSTQSAGLEKLKQITESNGNPKKYRRYVTKDTFQTLKTLALSDAPSKTKEEVAVIWGKILRKDDESLLKMVKFGTIDAFAEIISKSKEPSVQAAFIEQLKPLFKYVSHQEALIKNGVLQLLIRSLQNPILTTTTKVFEVLLCFDATHHPEMIRLGIISQLKTLMFYDNIQIQTRALALIQCFDAPTQDELVNHGIISELMKLFSIEKPVLQMKIISVLQRFENKYQKTMIEEGLLTRLRELISHNHPPLVTKVFECISDFLGQHQQALIDAEILSPLIESLHHSESTIRVLALDLISKFQAEYAVKRGILDQLKILLSTSVGETLERSFQFLMKMEGQVQEDLVKEGVLETLIEILRKSADEIPPTLFQAVPAVPAVPEDNSQVFSQSSQAQPSLSALIEGRYLNMLETLLTIPRKWTCPTCNLENFGILTKCSVCATQRPSSRTTSSTNLQVENAIQVEESPLPSQNSQNSQEQSEDPTPAVDVPVQNSMSVDNNIALTVVESTPVQVEPQVEARIQVENPVQVEPQVEAQPPSLEWSCPACTYLNSNHLTQCEICDTVKPIRRNLVQNTSSRAVQVEGSSSNLKMSRSVSSLGQVEDVPGTNLEQIVQLENVHQVVLTLTAIRNFDVKFQQMMVDMGILTLLKNLLRATSIQTEVVKTIIYFEQHYSQIISEGIFTAMAISVRKKNIKLFLSAMERLAEHHQEEMVRQGGLSSLVALLSVNELSVQSRITDFIMEISRTYKKDVMAELKSIASSFNKGSTGEFCIKCLQVGSHLASCPNAKSVTRSKKAPPINYGLISQAKRLLWQLENGGIRLLKYHVIFNDGGEHFKNYRVKNMLNGGSSSVYSSENRNCPVNIILEFSGKGHPLVTHLVFKNPPLNRYDSPVKSLLVFISNSVPDLKASRKFDSLTEEGFNSLKTQKDPKNPTVFVNMSANYIEISLENPTPAKYILLKLLSAAKKNYDFEFAGFIGIVVDENLQLENFQLENQVEYRSLTDIGNQLGIKKRVKRLDFNEEYKGLLWWLGTNSGQENWENPHTSGHVILTTSHSMYDPRMRIEDIIELQGVTSCYWGGSTPQYFIMDLKNRRLRATHLTLRHGYQASNSYIQNWEFSGRYLLKLIST
eukprot:TRINITY_DN7016_c0_g1_i6.p1 TRINITY_DN7016_c0_g1~~TRINITY_DN7016_c0_g1_i6.p1  ORF type:complete len:1300 (-),score=459.60 TRINITY_DN7016_c0_g1_i6:376-4230(-)